jgi:predicted membrane protein
MDAPRPSLHTNVQFNIDRSANAGCGFWIGLTFIVIGAGLFLDVLGVISFRPALSLYWPSILMVGSLIQLMRRRSFVGPIIVFAVGALLQADKLGLLEGSFWMAFWSLFLVLVGWSLLWGMRKKKALEGMLRGMMHGADSSERTIKQSVWFGGSDLRSSTQDFQGGELTAVAGGIEVDLRNADIQETATLSVVAIMGGVEIRVPPHWRVITNGTPILGGIDNRTFDPTDSNVIAPTLIVNSTVILGGLEIHP